MELRDRVIVITGGARGIGEAMARRFAREGAKAVVVCDRDEAAVQKVAQSIVSDGGAAIGVRADVSVESEIEGVARLAGERYGRIDLFCSNAGVIFEGGPDASDPIWTASWSVNVMAHVYAARAALPGMLARGEGYFLNTCSSAGLLTSLGAAPYAVTKHAAIAFAEWMAITYGAQGIKVSALCPQAVRTDMLAAAGSGAGAQAVASAGRIVEPADAADAVVAGLAAERFLILTHEETAQYVQRKASDIDRWIAGMRKFATPPPA